MSVKRSSSEEVDGNIMKKHKSTSVMNEQSCESEMRQIIDDNELHLFHLKLDMTKTDLPTDVDLVLPCYHKNATPIEDGPMDIGRKDDEKYYDKFIISDDYNNDDVIDNDAITDDTKKLSGNYDRVISLLTMSCASQLMFKDGLEYHMFGMSYGQMKNQSGYRKPTGPTVSRNLYSFKKCECGMDKFMVRLEEVMQSDAKLITINGPHQYLLKRLYKQKRGM